MQAKNLLGWETPLIIAEIAQAHDGSLSLAHAYIDAVSEAGADAVKFQIHIASEESTYDDVFRLGVSTYDKARYEYWRRIEFSTEQWRGLAEHAAENKLKFFASAFSDVALELLKDLNVPLIKIASGEITNNQLLDAIKVTGLPVLLSTGMSNWEEIDYAVNDLVGNGIDVTLMQCTSKYPTPLSQVGLNVLGEFKEKYDIKVGLSDHSGTLFPGLVAIGLQVDMLEVHVVFDKRMGGLDTSSSLTIDNLAFLVQYRSGVREMMDNPVDKDKLARELSDVRKCFGRSLAVKHALAKGSVLTADDICLKKPGTGINPNKLSQVIGRRLSRNVSHDRLLTWGDVHD